MKRFFIADVGGSFIKSAVVLENADIISSAAEKTPETYGGIISALKYSMFEASADACLIAIPGVYGAKNDRVLTTPNIPSLNGMPLHAPLDCGVPLFIANDADMAALGEYHHGFDKRPGSMVFLTLGTGLGGGVIFDGKLLTADTTITELGHVTLVADGRLCGCGKKGCVERYCSSSAIVANYTDVSGEGKELHEIAELFDAGNAEACKAFDIFARHLAHALSSFINIFNPECIRLGGGLSELHRCYFSSVLRHLDGMMFPAYRGMADIAVASLKNSAAVYGGVEWLKQRLG